jgi:hypothetical protein
VFVFLIMAGKMPNLYFFMHGTHVHHLNYGIFLMAAVCGYSVFRRPIGRAAEITALLYGVAMGLTFDEFGMWLHLGGSYWQRASVDAVIVVTALFGLISFARSLKRFEARHFWASIIMLIMLIGFCRCLIHRGHPPRRYGGTNASRSGSGFLARRILDSHSNAAQRSEWSFMRASEPYPFLSVDGNGK